MDIKKQILKYFNLLNEFGFFITYNELYLRVVGKIFGNNSIIWKKASAIKYEKINNYLKDEFGEIISKYKYSEEVNRIKKDDPIWVFWAQGIENAPSIVKLCVDSIKKNAGEHPVNILNNENYENYVQINSNIKKKYQEGYISIVHFSDVLRFNLLAQKGGIWCDSTLFFSDKIDANQIDNLHYFSIKHNIGKNYLACRGLWTTFFLRQVKKVY